MLAITLPYITMACYLLASITQGFKRHWLPSNKLWLFILGTFAICLHSFLLHAWIDSYAGQNLSFFNMLSLTAWLVSLLVLVLTLTQSLEILLLFIFPLTACTIFLDLHFPSHYLLNTGATPNNLFHILLAILTFALLCVAALVALLLGLQERLLRYHFASRLIQKLPPLAAVEKLLFQIICSGFLLLSAILITSLFSYSDILLKYPGLIQKTILAIIAWFIFAILLIGRLKGGWRGKKAIFYTLSGVLILFIIYFGLSI